MSYLLVAVIKCTDKATLGRAGWSHHICIQEHRENKKWAGYEACTVCVFHTCVYCVRELYVYCTCLLHLFCVLYVMCVHFMCDTHVHMHSGK